ncbi:DUF1127 domain-containing protein [Thalassococcus sp. CAU 1522]|uniref:DUF1127 domain-containing protein n=1 Tax=Thalassococcus arenae TaxID=2851652 RepID=A0ABS6NBF0_9RHOB|nr:DUF1127 domain-containing protein [Thalassococcus arenae]MBV2361108.1 DUF1127 domain-containing protein [Thalassococcus arenae]
MTQIAYRSALATLEATRPLPVLAGIALRVAVVLAVWSQRRRTRIALADLDAHMLRDIGIEPEIARAEARRPFWLG